MSDSSAIESDLVEDIDLSRDKEALRKYIENNKKNFVVKLFFNLKI